jgi:hypothetical protein
MDAKYVDQMVIKYTKIFHSKTLQNLPKLGFLFENKPSGNPAFRCKKGDEKNPLWARYVGGWVSPKLSLASPLKGILATAAREKKEEKKE